MNTFKITFSNGDKIITDFNGSFEIAQDYYLNNWFEFAENEPMEKGILVEQL